MARGFVSIVFLLVSAVLLNADSGIPGGSTNPFPDLKDAGESFRFAILADPQVSPKEHKGRVAVDAHRTMCVAVDELNQDKKPPLFAVFLGDLVNVPDWPSWEHFIRGIAPLKSQSVFVHGNHDTRPPFDSYRKVQKQICGIEDLYFSFDAGQWHFVSIPCNLDGNTSLDRQIEKEMLDWLDRDLKANRDKPTIVFGHLHLMPVGLSQPEWYNYPLPLRRAIIDTITRYGNVRYYFNGHIHNGVKVSLKTAVNYEGVNFITVPTIIASRPFGEEFPEFAEGQKRGGYYLVIDIKGRDAKIEARLAGDASRKMYPDQFRTFTKDMEPRWFSSLPDLPASTGLSNGDFEKGLDGWLSCYRYLSDENPGYAWNTGTPPVERDGKALRLFTREKGQDWADDEYTQLYQIVSVSPDESPVLRVDYLLSEPPKEGGGYIRLVGMSEDQFKCLMMLRWGGNEEKSHHLPRAVGYHLNGRQQSWLYLQHLGEQKKGFYWRIPEKPGVWNSVTVNPCELYDAVHGSGAWKTLGVQKIQVALGTWANKDKGARNEAWFDNVSLAPGDTSSSVNGKALAITDDTFRCGFGQKIEDAEIAHRKQREKIAKMAGLPRQIQNGNAEQAQAEGNWPLYWYHSADYVQWSEEASEGSRCLRLEDNSKEEMKNGDWRTPLIGVTPDSRYRLLWSWKYQDARNLEVAVRLYDANGVIVRVIPKQAEGSCDAFRPEELAFDVPGKIRALDVLVRTVDDGTGTAWVDEFRLEEK